MRSLSGRKREREIHNPARLYERAFFDEPHQDPDGAGGIETNWVTKYACRAQFIYARGSETIEAARLSGRAIYKVKIRQCYGARQITTDWRMRDARRGTQYNIRECDSITDRRWIYLVVESGVAV